MSRKALKTRLLPTRDFILFWLCYKDQTPFHQTGACEGSRSGGEFAEKFNTIGRRSVHFGDRVLDSLVFSLAFSHTMPLKSSLTEDCTLRRRLSSSCEIQGLT